MTRLSARITRLPHVFDARSGHETRKAFADLGAQSADLLAGAAGCSPYLYDLINRESEWLRGAFAASPEESLAQILAPLDSAEHNDSATGERGTTALGRDLRLAKRRTALLAALCDLGGIWPLESVTGALSELADRAVSAALRRFVGDEIRRKKLPGAVAEDAQSAGGMVALAMGKMGAYELNYSSDIDLICLFDETRYVGAESEARASFIRVTRKMSMLLSDLTADGYVFRTDLRLRPDASVTPVCLSMAAAESYYESEGRTWERGAYIKARPCAGDLAAGARFLTTLTPFVWRKHLDFSAIQDAHDMRLRIRDHRGLHGPIQVEGHDMKLGAGGIREIEFYAQTRQLIAGGRDASLRARGTVTALGALAEKGWIAKSDADELAALYRAHRETEHRLQMVGDAQTHRLPTSAEGVARIAAFCGQSEADFRTGLLARLERTEALTEGLFTPKDQSDSEPEISPQAAQIVEGWLRYPALRSPRARTLFKRVRPHLLAQLSRAAHPDEAFQALDGFMVRLPAGVQLFALFDANPTLIELIVDIAATAPRLAQYLARNAAVLDAVIGGSFWQAWPPRTELRHALADTLSDIADYEDKLNAARRWMKEWHFRIGVHHLRGLIDAFEAAKSYADLAEVVIQVMWQVVGDEFSRRHGPAPGLGAAVMAMGSLGAARMGASSDLDLIVIYDASGAETSTGPKPLATRPYFARLTQTFLTALTAQMPDGRLYDVDMRLRPSGRQGPVATSLHSFINYQENDAWSWEHLALSRARVIAGDPHLAGDIETFRRDVLQRKGQEEASKPLCATKLARAAREMRARLFAAKQNSTIWETKNGPGRVMDIELLAQVLCLRTASAARSTERQLRAAQTAKHMSQTETQQLLTAYRLMWRLHYSARLLSEAPLNLEQLGAGGQAFLLRECGVQTMAELAQKITEHSAQTAALLNEKLGETSDVDTPSGPEGPNT